MYVDIFGRLRDAVRKKRLVNWRTSRQCSSTPVGFGQWFLTKQPCDNTGASTMLSWLGCSWVLSVPLTEMSIDEAALLWCYGHNGRSQWPRGLRRGSAAARLLRLWVRIPPGTWMFVCCECCVLLGRCLCDELITLPEESYRLWCVVVCDLETSWMRGPWTTRGLSRQKQNK